MKQSFHSLVLDVRLVIANSVVQASLDFYQVIFDEGAARVNDHA